MGRKKEFVKLFFKLFFRKQSSCQDRKNPAWHGISLAKNFLIFFFSWAEKRLFFFRMLNIETIKAGRLATVLLKGEHKMNKGGRAGVPANPLLGRVTRDHRVTVTVAGPQTYSNVCEARTGEAPIGKSPWFRWIQDGVVEHKENGNRYLAAVPTSAHYVTRYLVDGREATESELKTIREFTPDKGEPQFLCFALENVANLAD